MSLFSGSGLGSTLGELAGLALGGPLGGFAGSALGGLAGSALFGSGNYGAGGIPQGGNLVSSINPVGVSNTAPLLSGAANQAGKEASGAMANRYGTLGLGNSTMATTDEAAAKSFPMIQAAGDIAKLDLGAQEFNSNLDLSAQEFNAKAAQQYQQQAQALNTQLQSLLFSGSGSQNPTGGPGTAITNSPGNNPYILGNPGGYG